MESTNQNNIIAFNPNFQNVQNLTATNPNGKVSKKRNYNQFSN